MANDIETFFDGSNPIGNPVAYANNQFGRATGLPIGVEDWGKSLPVAGSYFTGKKEAEAQAETNQMNQANFERQIELQREFAKNGLTWKIDDAAQRGINPLTAIGAPTQSYSTMNVQQQSPKHAMARAGQDISASMFRLALQQEQISSQMQSSQLDNELKSAQIAKIRAETLQLGSPSTTLTNPDQPYATKDPQAMVTWTRQPGNKIIALPSQFATEAMENDLPAKIGFNVNRVMGAYKPPQEMLPSGTDTWERAGLFTWEAVNRGLSDKPKGKKYGEDYTRQKWFKKSYNMSDENNPALERMP